MLMTYTNSPGSFLAPSRFVAHTFRVSRPPSLSHEPARPVARWHPVLGGKKNAPSSYARDLSGAPAPVPSLPSGTQALGARASSDPSPGCCARGTRGPARGCRCRLPEGIVTGGGSETNKPRNGSTQRNERRCRREATSDPLQAEGRLGLTSCRSSSRPPQQQPYHQQWRGEGPTAPVISTVEVRNLSIGAPKSENGVAGASKAGCSRTSTGRGRDFSSDVAPGSGKKTPAAEAFRRHHPGGAECQREAPPAKSLSPERRRSGEGRRSACERCIPRKPHQKRIYTLRCRPRRHYSVRYTSDSGENIFWHSDPG
jgi:hypothetical protein